MKKMTGIKSTIFVTLSGISLLCSAASPQPIPDKDGIRPSVFFSNQSLYLGVSGGYGTIYSNPPPSSDGFFLDGLIQEIITQVIDIGLNPTRDAGGFSGRVYTGYLLNINDRISLGPEIGVSLYHDTQFTTNTQGISSLISSFENAPSPGSSLPTCASTTTQGLCEAYYSSIDKTQGYGFDFLLNGSYSPVERLTLYVKPGFQLAHEKTSTSAELSIELGKLDPVTLEPQYQSLNIPINFSNTATMVTPEIIVGAGWRIFPVQPLYLGASYQYVFDSYSWSNTADRVSSRGLLSLNLEYRI